MIDWGALDKGAPVSPGTAWALVLLRKLLPELRPSRLSWRALVGGLSKPGLRKRRAAIAALLGEKNLRRALELILSDSPGCHAASMVVAHTTPQLLIPLARREAIAGPELGRRLRAAIILRMWYWGHPNAIDWFCELLASPDMEAQRVTVWHLQWRAAELYALAPGKRARARLLRTLETHALQHARACAAGLRKWLAHNGVRRTPSQIARGNNLVRRFAAEWLAEQPAQEEGGADGASRAG